jgi:hypothetical protein
VEMRMREASFVESRLRAATRGITRDAGGLLSWGSIAALTPPPG